MPALPPAMPGSALTGAGVQQETPVDRAMALALAGERDAAMRWAAAIVREDAQAATALLVCGRLLGEAGRHEVAREALRVAVERSIDLENLPLAVAAACEIGRWGGDAGPCLDTIAAAFARGASRSGEGAAPPVALPPAASFQPLPSALTGVALTNRATEIVHEARRKLQEQKDRPGLRPLALFGELDRDSLRGFIATMTPVWLAPGTVVVSQDEEGAEAYFVARGGLEAVRVKNEETIRLARIVAGDLFGEMALLSRSPRTATVTADRPSVVLQVEKDVLDAMAEKHPAIGERLALHCRDRLIENLLRTSEVLQAVPAEDHPALVSKFQVRVFEKNDVLIVQDQSPSALFLIASGSVTAVRREGDGDPLVLGTLQPGDVVGEVAMILRRKANADVIALAPTVCLALRAGDFMALVKDHPSILAGLYLLAVERDEETASILEDESAVADDKDIELI
jgi:CRP-like cAMP-binding protein